LKKSIYAILIVSLLLSGLLIARASPSTGAVGSEMAGHFSNQKMSAETGDCGGYDLWLTKSGQSLQGELAVYEGNCESNKWKLESVNYDPKTGAFSFKAPYYHDDFYWVFKGTLKRDRVSGTFSLFEKASKENTFNDKVILLKTP
jgi:hypothetical protein